MEDCNVKKTVGTMRETLLSLGAILDKNIEVFADRTRDRGELIVFRDKVTKVIFIDDYYVGDSEYISGEYRGEIESPAKLGAGGLEDLIDSERRFSAYRQFVVAKSVCDFGCGAGNFLKLSAKYAKKAVGVELQKNFVDLLNRDGIECYSDIEQVRDMQDSVFMFHCLEHLLNPVAILKAIYVKLKQNGDGKIVIEVPHARDFLIDKLVCQPFIDFTLWSQHLVLHTRESLTLMLVAAGYKNIYIEGVQRYGLANHLHWLNSHRPGGHKELLSVLETQNLVNAYSEALSKVDANDTLVAFATT